MERNAQCNAIKEYVTSHGHPTQSPCDVGCVIVFMSIIGFRGFVRGKELFGEVQGKEARNKCDGDSRYLADHRLINTEYLWQQIKGNQAEEKTGR